MDQRRVVRVFVSSPSDVRPERLLAARMIERLGREFSYHLRVEAVLWEREPLVATHHFQDYRNIPPPRSADIVLVVLWSRLGVPLPEAEFRGAVSGRAVTGTEWEFEDALGHARVNRQPDLLVYRKTAPVTVSLEDDEKLEQQRRQKHLVEDFMRRWFQDGDATSFTSAFQAFQTPEEFEARLYDHLRALLLRRLPGDAAQAGQVRWHDAPFVGLRAFEADDAAIFFGRTRARNELRERLAARAARGRAAVLVMGASGAGKSSLVKAGLLPDLMLPGMIGRVALCRCAVMRPSDHAGDPLAALASALLAPAALPALAAAPFSEDGGSLARLLRAAPAEAARPIRQGLAAAARAAEPKLTEIAEARLVLVVDQLEELFAPGIGDDVRHPFLAALTALADSGGVWVVATLRSDFFDRLERCPELAALAPAEARYLLPPPDESEIGQMIRLPAQEAGLRFEADARQGLSLDEVLRGAAGRDPTVLPLLSFLLAQLWAARTSEGVLTFAAYERLGGLEGGIAERAEAEVAALPAAAQAALPALLRSLVTVADDLMATARPAPMRTEAADPGRTAAIERLVAARLLVTGAGAGGPVLRLAHEALITRWPRLARLVADDQAFLRIRTRLQADEARWRREGRPDDLLLPSGTRLTEVAAVMAERRDELDPELTAFFDASMAAEARRQAAARAAGSALQQEAVPRWLGIGRVAGIVALVAALLVPLLLPTAFDAPRLALFDCFMRLRPRVPAGSPVVIVAIDDASLQRVGQWPWPRSVTAALVARLASGHPAALGVHLLWPEPDRLSPPNWVRAEPGLPPDLARQLAALPDNDAILAEALAAAPVAIGVGLGAGGPPAGVVTPIRIVGGDPAPMLPHYANALRSLPLLDRAARGHGTLTTERDSDGFIRRVPTVQLAGGTPMPTLDLEMVRLAVGAPDLVLVADAGGARSVAVGPVAVPTEPDSTVWVHFAGRGGRPTVSAADVLDGTVPAAAFKDRLVLVAAMAGGLAQTVETPLGPMYAPEIAAEFLETLIDGRVPMRPRWAPWAEAVLTLAVGIGLILGLSRRHPAWYAAVAGIAGLALGLAGLAAWDRALLLVDVATPGLGLGLVLAALLAGDLVEANRRRRRLRAALEGRSDAVA